MGLRQQAATDLGLMFRTSGELVRLLPGGDASQRMWLTGVVNLNAESAPQAYGYTQQLSTRFHEITLLRSELGTYQPKRDDVIEVQNPEWRSYTIKHVAPDDDERVTVFAR